MPLASVLGGQIVKGEGILGVVFANEFLLDLQCLPIQRFGPCEVMSLIIQISQATEAVHILGAVHANDFLLDLQSLPIQWFGPCEVALANVLAG